MNKEIETIKAEINTLSKGIETYHDMVSDKLTSLAKRLDDLTKKEKPANEITQEDWMWIPDATDWWHFVSDNHDAILSTAGLSYHSKYATYNIFKTKELAESRKHLSPLQRKWAFILDYLGRDENKIFALSETKHYPIFSTNEIIVSFIRLYDQDRHLSQYATSEEMCKKAIEIMGDDIYSYLGVEKTICP